MDNVLVVTYAAYLLISLPLTLMVGRSLFKHGRTFLLDAFDGNETLADSVNHLLIIGFYLINCGWVSRSMLTSTEISNAAQSMEFLAARLGSVLIGLGVMHFFNMFVLSRIRRRGMISQAPPPILPTEYLRPKQEVA